MGLVRLYLFAPQSYTLTRAQDTSHDTLFLHPFGLKPSVAILSARVSRIGF